MKPITEVTVIRDGQTVWYGNIHNEPEFVYEGRVVQFHNHDTKVTTTLLLKAGDIVEVKDLK